MHDSDRLALDHLDRMTDSTGLIQHAIYSVPRRGSGYTTDDNARALRLCTRLWDRRPGKRMLSRITVYLSFLEHARCFGRGFHNFLSYDRHWLDTEGTSDCQGQVVRALAEMLSSSLPNDYHALARELIDSVLTRLIDLRSLRAQAYIILAWGRLRAAGVKDIEPIETVAWSAAQRLMECYRHATQPDWPWFESRMTYANAVLPHALFVAGQCWPEETFLDVAEASFDFLDCRTTATATFPHKGKGGAVDENVFWPVGNFGWYPYGEKKALYDQQPVEAVTMAEAALAAFTLVGEEKYLVAFRRAHAWFHGWNSLSQPLADASCGTCCDGLQSSGVNRNQGAESTLAYLWTELCHHELHSSIGNDCKMEPVSVSPLFSQEKSTPQG
jgi:hypothetical protein